ncbi:baseplate assembly protein [Novosphingobium sediminicola]|uniref:Phage-related baseplate assembly protein n=1 Tax=Novosphingobium sediminicola TaxID=563162 RepID=A0A7W6CL08_9SPHN|nr:baseplate J/gp47 family protein [Novosphingobium sediminicola]MBB3953392.1 phage-related baseplate assembly protein [Novosphingobium sediminicola]
MSTSTSAIDLSQLPAPTVVEALDYASIRADLVADVQELLPTWDATVESDPAIKVLEVAAYRELLIRQQFNERARQCLLAYATDTNLDHLGALLGVARLTDEGDDAFKARIQLAPDAFSVAGPESAYEFHARSADSTIADAKVTSPSPGVVLVSILSASGDGTASDTQIAHVEAALAGVCPLTDQVIVQSVQIIPYTLTAALTLFDGPDGDVVLANALAGAQGFVAAARKIGRDINRANIFAAIGVAGISNVALTGPDADMPMDDTQCGYCLGINLTVTGRGE